MTFADNLNADEALQNVTTRLKSKLFDTEIIIILAKYLIKSMIYFLHILKEKNRKNTVHAKSLAKLLV